MIIWRKDDETGLTCGINDNGDCSLGMTIPATICRTRLKIVNTF